MKKGDSLKYNNLAKYQKKQILKKSTFKKK